MLVLYQLLVPEACVLLRTTLKLVDRVDGCATQSFWVFYRLSMLLEVDHNNSSPQEQSGVVTVHSKHQEVKTRQTRIIWIKTSQLVGHCFYCTKNQDHGQEVSKLPHDQGSRLLPIYRTSIAMQVSVPRRGTPKCIYIQRMGHP